MTTDVHRDDVNQYLVFGIGDEEFGCNVNVVREVIRAQKVTRVPHCGQAVAGVINYRGDLRPVVDLVIKLGLSSAETTSESRFVLIDAEGEGFCFMVDCVTRTIALDSTLIEPPSALTMDHEAEYIAGIAKLDRGLVVLIDPARLAADLCHEPVERGFEH